MLFLCALRQKFLRFVATVFFLGLFSLSASAFDTEKLALIPALVEAQIQAENLPGAVILIGHQGHIVYRQAFGQRTRKPAEALRADAIFDLASLTKPIATATAILQLAEREQLQLDAPLARYWPEFAAHGKEHITIRQLLTHSSGLRAGLDLRQSWNGRAAALQALIAEKPLSNQNGKVLYSDLNFIALGELVQRVSGQNLDVYCQQHIFKPLGMHDTAYQPPTEWSARIAPTGFLQGHLRIGEVHDPIARRMGGVAGHAGLFSSADDLARFAQAILNGGTLEGYRLLSPHSIALLSLPQTTPELRPEAQSSEAHRPLCQTSGAHYTANTACQIASSTVSHNNKNGLLAPYQAALRTLGWRADPPLSSQRPQLPPLGAIGHNGYTGTSLWIDPISQTYVILLSHRVHPAEQGDAGPLRERLAHIVSAAVGAVDTRGLQTNPQLTAYTQLPPLKRRPIGLQTGIDVLLADDFAALAQPQKPLRIGLITHQSGIDKLGRRTIDLLQNVPGIQLVALFSPEHGLQGKLDSKVPSGMDALSGLPVHSLYGETRRPSPAMLADIDALVFDLQDVGVRFYTYITTMGYAMEAAAAQGKRFIVLDRPNPLGGEQVLGPLSEEGHSAFTAYHRLPIQHGMTVGELALLFDAERNIGAHPEIVKMRHYRRANHFARSGLIWIPPSPNLRNQNAVTLYPGLGMLEGTNLSVGRGTPTPFELIGAPWIDGQALADELNRRQLPGLRFSAHTFTPTENTYAQRPCQGVRVHLDKSSQIDAIRLGIEIADILTRRYPKQFELERSADSIGSKAAVKALRKGIAPNKIIASWQQPLADFRKVRQKYLLY